MFENNETKTEIFRKHEIQTRITHAEKQLNLFQLEDFKIR